MKKYTITAQVKMEQIYGMVTLDKEIITTANFPNTTTIKKINENKKTLEKQFKKDLQKDIKLSLITSLKIKKIEVAK